MFPQIKSLIKLLTKAQRAKLIKLQIMVVLMGLLELVSVLSIGPFVALASNPSQVEANNLLSAVYEMSGIDDPSHFIFWFGVCVLVILTIASFFSVLTTWKMAIFGASIGSNLSTRLYNLYINEGWLYHTVHSTSELSSKISQECGKITTGVIQPLLQINARFVAVIFIAVSVFLISPVVAVSGLITFFAAYLTVYKVVRARLQQNGLQSIAAQKQRFKLLAEGFGGIKEILLTNTQVGYVSDFESESNRFTQAQAKIQIISQVPRYVIELVAFGGVIFLMLVLIADSHGNIVEILPILAIYALAGFKLLPACQQIYAGASLMKGNINAFELLQRDLEKNFNIETSAPVKQPRTIEITKKSRIFIDNVSFCYPGKNQPALKNVTIEVSINDCIGLVGPSGSGKSTLADILLGLITPSQGKLKIDHTQVDNNNVRDWQSQIGFVPQTIFLSDSTIRENIAFGIDKATIDDNRVLECLRLAHLEEFVSTLANGLNTTVGERGVQMSGGQRQRIGIARALYRDPQILIFDEATSALDGTTEKAIMEAVQDFAGKKTIILIAHRLTTVRKCDRLYILEEGAIVGHGTYTQLLSNNRTFQRLVGDTEESKT